MPDFITSFFSLLGFLALSVLPGGWLSFSRLGNGFTAWERFFIGMALTPFIVLLQFYLLRVPGIPFAATCYLIVFINLPVIWLMKQSFSGQQSISLRGLLLIVGAAFIPVVYASIRIIDPYAQMLFAHSFLHSEIIYQLARGELYPMEAGLAGVKLGYPWAGHVYLAVVSWILDVAPARCFPLINFLSLVTMFGLMYHITGRLGGKLLSKVLVFIALAFAVNAVGTGLQLFFNHVAPGTPFEGAVENLYIFGESRYAPWIKKYHLLNLNHFGFSLYTALLLISVAHWQPRNIRGPVILSGAFLIAMGLIYPIMYPVACAISGAKIISAWFSSDEQERLARVQIASAVTGALVVSAVATVLYYLLVASGRLHGSGITIESFYGMKVKLVQFTTTLSLLGLGFVVLFLKKWQSHRNAMIVITLSVLGCLVVYDIFILPHWRNEYKYIMAAAIPLAPFGFMALEPLFQRLGKALTLVTVIVITALLIAQPVWKLWSSWPKAVGYNLAFEQDGFILRLQTTEPLYQPLAAIRSGTPADTMVVAAESNIYLPIFMSRDLFVSYPGDIYLAGLGLEPDYALGKVKGHGQEILDARKSQVLDLYYSNDESVIHQTLLKLLAIRSPVAVLLETGKHQVLHDTLRGRANLNCELVFENGSHAVWLVSQ